MYRTLFSRDLFSELDRLQREMQQASDISPNIRGLPRGGFPAINTGNTAQSVEIIAFAPGIDPNTIDLHIEKSVLTIAGERPPASQGSDEKTTAHIDERFSGRFRRVITLPDDIEVNAVKARYRDGVLHISIPRRQATQPRRISIE